MSTFIYSRMNRILESIDEGRFDKYHAYTTGQYRNIANFNDHKAFNTPSNAPKEKSYHLMKKASAINAAASGASEKARSMGGHEAIKYADRMAKLASKSHTTAMHHWAQHSDSPMPKDKSTKTDTAKDSSIRPGPAGLTKRFKIR